MKKFLLFFLVEIKRQLNSFDNEKDNKKDKSCRPR